MTDRPAERTTGSPASERRLTDTAAVPRTTARTRTPANTTTTAQRRPSAAPAAGTGPNQAAGRPRPSRRARLRVTRVDPWSVMKMSFLLSVALGIVTIVSVLILWSVLGAAGVWDSINKSVNDIVGQGSVWNISNYLGTSRVVGFTMIISVVDVILLTAVGTLSAFLYNMAAALLGGVELTLAEEQ